MIQEILQTICGCIAGIAFCVGAILLQEREIKAGVGVLFAFVVGFVLMWAKWGIS